MRITPGPGTVVVIVQQDGSEPRARIGRLHGHGGTIIAAARDDLPALEPGAPVVLLAQVAAQKLITDGTFERARTDGAGVFRQAGDWRAADNRRHPRLTVALPCEVRSRATRTLAAAVIRDLSLGGARLTLADGGEAMTGEVDLLVRYGGLSATLPGRLLGAPEPADDADDAAEPPADLPATIRVQFLTLALPQERFLHQLLGELAELAGWELAS